MLLRRVPSRSAGMESCKRSLCMNQCYQRESIASSLLRYSTGASLNSAPSTSSPPSAQPETRGEALPGAYDLHGYGRCRSLLLGIANMDNVRCKHVAARDRGRHRDWTRPLWVDTVRRVARRRISVGSRRLHRCRGSPRRPRLTADCS